MTIHQHPPPTLSAEMVTYGILWQLIADYDNVWQLMTIYGNLWQLMMQFFKGGLSLRLKEGKRNHSVCGIVFPYFMASNKLR